MDEHKWLAERFEEHRTRLRAVAYRMLSSLSDADDAVQEAWLRLSRANTGSVENLGGWLTTVVARVCLNMLRSRKSRREEPLGVNVPDPIISRVDGIDPEHEALLADAVASHCSLRGTGARRAVQARPGFHFCGIGLDSNSGDDELERREITQDNSGNYPFEYPEFT